MPQTYTAKVLDLPGELVKRFAGIYSDQEARALARILMEEITGIQLVKLLAEPDLNFQPDQLLRLGVIIERLIKNEPIQYILGFADFAGLRFDVRQGVLIPRGETEELVLWIEEDLRSGDSFSSEKPRILDIGCGSGIIGVTLAKKFPNAEVVCADKYPVPQDVSRENGAKLGVAIEVMCLDILRPDEAILTRQFDIIVSNPPYVTNYQKKAMKDHVLLAEPLEALFVSDEDPLIFYRAIADFACETLTARGCLYLEINEDLSTETMTLLEDSFQQVELRRDIHGKPRMIKAYDRQRKGFI